jgi:AAA ATPase domain
MLRSMQLENFKAFGQRVTIPLAPITLIFGENSSGKTSILQALSLLKQTIDHRSTGAVLLPRTDGGYTDLGTFQELTFDQDTSREVTIRIDSDSGMNSAEPDTISPIIAKKTYLKSITSFGYELTFSRKDLDCDISLDRLHVYLNEQSTPLASFMPLNLDTYKRLPPKTGQHRSLKSRLQLLPERRYQCASVFESHSIFEPMYQQALLEREELREAIEAEIQEWDEEFGDNPGVIIDPLAIHGDDDSLVHKLRTLTAELKKLAQHLSFERFKKRTLATWKRSEISLVGIDASQQNLTEWYDSTYFVTGLFIPGGRKPNDEQLNLSWLVEQIGVSYRRNITRLCPLGPFRKPPQRWYTFSGTTPTDVGYDGATLPDLLYRTASLVENTNKWLNKLEIGYKIQTNAVSDRNPDLYEITLKDLRRGGDSQTEVGLSNVGFGISQVLPMIVQSLVSENQIITIEQPEVHIHPRLQADLGDLFIESIEEPRQNQFIIETHSEHLALRLQRRVREKKLSPDQLSILYVSRGPNGSTVQPLRLDEEGDFIDDFPGGFFPERLRELR